MARAAALASARDPVAAVAALDAIDPAASGSGIAAYQPCWAVRAHVLCELGRHAEADDAYARAIALSEDPAVRAFLLDRRADLTA